MRLNLGGVAVFALSMLASAAHAGFEMDEGVLKSAKKPEQKAAPAATGTATAAVPAPQVEAAKIAQKAAEPAPAVPVAATVAAEAPKPQVCHWTTSPEDGKLSVTLERWTAKAGYQLSWEVTGEEPAIGMTASYCDRNQPFHVALDELLAAFDHTKPMRAIIHKGNNAVQLVSGAR